MFTLQLCAVLIGFFYIAKAENYNFRPIQHGACDESEDKPLDSFFNLSNIYWREFDSETIILDGYVTFLKEIDGSLDLHVKFIRQNKDREWIETPYKIYRKDVCSTIFDKNEKWFELVQELLEDNPKSCPPEKGARYEFKEKKISRIIKDLPADLDGYVEVVIKLFTGDDLIFCIYGSGYMEF